MTSSALQSASPLTLRLAQRIHGFDAGKLGTVARQAVRTAIIDTIGVTLAGSAEPCVRLLLQTPGVAPPMNEASLFGMPSRTSTLDACLVNGTASHALDYDDFSEPMGGHHSVPLVTPLLALAEARHASGEAVMRAYAIGMETESRIARAVNFHHYDKGWHPTATVGIFGTVAAASHLIGLGVESTAMALAIAASLASGLKANFGTMTKPLHVGHTCRSGMMAVLLAERGFEANPGALEHKQGFMMAFNGPGTFNIDAIFEHWTEPLEIEGTALGLKQFPCCGSTHPAIAMALSLKREERIDAEQIERIEILAHPRRLPHTDNPRPQTALAGKFSIQYVVARALADGAVRLAHFEGDAHREARIVRLLERTHTGAHPDMPEDSPHQFGAEVSLTLRDGRTVSRRVDDMIGRGVRHPMSGDELWEKFEDCSRRAIDAAQAMALYERLETFESIPDIAVLARLFARHRVPGSPGAGHEPPPAIAPASSNTLLETSWVP